MQISLSLLALVALAAARPHLVSRQDNDLLFCEDGVDTQGDLIGQAFDSGTLQLFVNMT